MIRVFQGLVFWFVMSSGSVIFAKNLTEQIEWQFKVYLDDSHIGYHYYTLEQNGQTALLSTKAEFEVQFLFFTVYDYFHENVEVWNGDCLSSMQSKTEDNGTKWFVSIQSDEQGSHIKTSNEHITLNQCLKSFAYWNLEYLNSEYLLNAQTGELLAIEFKSLGQETLTIDEKMTETLRYQIKGEKIDIDLWYSNDRQWLALQSITEDGYILRYEKMGSTP